MYFAPPLKGFRLEFDTGAWIKKKQNYGATGPRKKFDDIFSRLDTIGLHERDGETDGQTD